MATQITYRDQTTNASNNHKRPNVTKKNKSVRIIKQWRTSSTRQSVQEAEREYRHLEMAILSSFYRVNKQYPIYWPPMHAWSHPSHGCSLTANTDTHAFPLVSRQLHTQRLRVNPVGRGSCAFASPAVAKPFFELDTTHSSCVHMQ